MAHRRLLLGLVAVLALVVAACGGGGSDNGSAAPSTGADASEAKGEINPDATLRVAVRRPNTTLDPHVAATTVEEQLLDLIYDRLFRLQPDGTIIGELAESHDFTDEGLVLKLREGVEFQDGTPLDAEAVKINIDRARTLEESALKADLSTVSAVEVVDPATVLLRMPKMDTRIVPVLSTRAGAMVSPASIEAGTVASKPIGAGPFKIGEFTLDVRLDLERWEGYWNPDIVDVAKLEIMVLPDTAARMNAVRSGQADVAQIEPNQLPEAEGAGLVAKATNMQTVAAIMISVDNVPAFADERVRKAVNHAIDREGIVNGLLQGHGEPTAQFFPPGSVAHDDSVEDLYPYDPEKAKKLLAEAGYPDGFEFTVNFGTTPSTEELEAVAGSLSEVGITMHVETLPGNETITRYFGGTGEAMAFPGNTDYFPSLAFKTFLPKNPWNPANLTSDRVTELWNQVLVTEDQGEQIELLKEASRELAEHPLQVVSLYSQTSTWVMTKDVVGFEPPPTNLWNFRNVGLSN